ncbi:hypothetical protein BH721_00705 [Clostridium baratii]|uniref:hypothetical protein n=1 Tax=Clostridium baratii TaxID=1561 RepID=UPI0009A2CAB3|nr:hypothetical protein [Clostridium baratii]OPF51667.1 hypothetical protein A1M12_03770 [Clostridium baratii]OPF55261.1 hypothetical protein BH721_00705 [Clostridium baratii]OPF57544.1 hypothetical protein BH724_07960 [Clostridium baratii]OPF60358.1 hypothetical protein BH725_07220 [Clostridium baratii]
MRENKVNNSLETVQKRNEIEMQTTKEYISDSKELLNALKKVQDVILKADGEEIPFLIKVAQTNLTKTTISQCKNMIIELQQNFNDEGIALFIEKTISLITAAETANLIYGDLIKIKEVRSYLSKKTYNIILLRATKLLDQLKNTKYEESIKLNFIVDNLNQCNKVFEYCWDIYPENILSLEQTIVILNSLIKQRVKLGLDNYNVELLKLMIDKNKEKISDIKDTTIELDSNGQLLNTIKNNKHNLKSSLDESLIIKDNEVVSGLVALDTNTSLATITKDDATKQFINITNNVIQEVKESASNDFINVAFQKYYSIISAIETVNYMKGMVIDKKKIASNISKILTDMIYSNYLAITDSWSKIEEKSEEDYLTYSKEILNYSKMLFEAYRMDKDNKEALYRATEIEIILYKNRNKFKLKYDLYNKIKNNIINNTPIIKETYPEFKGLVEKTKDSKKKGFWSKIFN